MADGMVAVVKGLRECGLAVALMGNDGKTYTLVPNAAEGTAPGARQPQRFDAGAQVNERYSNIYGGGARNFTERSIQAEVMSAPSSRRYSCDSGAQATDGRYASVYQMQHCKVAPTSPPAFYSEFPPQRSDMRPGSGSFHVGGNGRSEAGFVPTRSTSYRGAMCWPDRGSVCSPRVSHGTDSFASSLRKYPVSSSPERSHELMERLVNYSQGRNYPRSPQRTHSPPPRSYDTMEGSARGSRQGLYEADRRQRAPEDCPTRDRKSPETESYMKTTFGKTSDARFVRDVTKRLRDTIKSMSNYSNLSPRSDICKSSATAEMCVSASCDNRSVDIETQVASDINSPAVAVPTVAAPTQSIRSVAVPLSAVPSCLLSSPTVIVEANHACRVTHALLPVSSQKSVQTSTSSVVPSESNGKFSKKSKSSSNCRIDEGLKDEILKWLEDNTDPKLKKLQDTVMKKLSKRYKKMLVSNSEKLSVKSEDKDHENDGKNIIDGIIDKLIRMHLRNREAVDSAEIIKVTRSDQSFEQTSEVLINEISLKKHNFSRTLKKEQVYDALEHKIKQWSSKAYIKQSLRTEILNLLHDAPINFHGLSKMVYLNTLAEAFVTKLNNAPAEHNNTTNRCDEDPEPSRCLCEVQKNPSQPTMEQLKILVADSLIELINKIKVKRKLESGKEIIKDLIKIVLDAIILLNSSDENFATEIAMLTKKVTMIPENKATKFEQLKNVFNGNEGVSSRSETCCVLQTASLNRCSVQISDESNSSRADKEESSEFNIYEHKLSEQIDEWVSSLHIPLARNKELRKHLVNDLASDIVDRYKYLELNKDCVYKTNELEHLKYQIFKWINKIVGDSNNEAVNHAAELLERIRVIQKPGTTSSHEQNIDLNKDTTNAGSSQNKELNADYDDGNVNLVYSESVISANTNLATEIATLTKKVTMVPENEAIKFATPCTGQIKNIFNGNEGVGSRSETCFVLENASLNRCSVKISDESNSSRADKEESSELNIYECKLSEQIDEWVSSLHIPLGRNKELRKHLVNDLASDIVDRYKYLELNKDCVYKTNELEHLKYQIFKWINKIVGDSNNEAVNHAEELLERIRVIQKPGTTSSHEQNIDLNKDTTNAGSSQKKELNADDDDGNLNLVYSESMISTKTNIGLRDWKDPEQNILMPADKSTQTDWYSLSDANINSIYGTLSDFQYIPIRTQTINTSTQTVFHVLIDKEFQTDEEQVPPASIVRISDSKSDSSKPLTSSLKPLSPGPNNPATPSIKQLNDEFEDYLNNWINDIPIVTNSPEEVPVAEKARIGIRHGIYKAIASAKSQAAVYFNRFYYEDVLADAIDELFDMLPQTQELKDKRYMLKVKLIEKAMDITDLIKIVATPASYKQELADILAANLLPRRTVKTENEDPIRLYEEMNIQCIVEDFILESCYKNEDKLKATAYRNKLKNEVESFINEAKKIRGKDFRDFNTEICLNDIISALCKVPAPSDATLKDEADEIILGHEIDQWFADLPIIKNNDPQEIFLRRRLKDALTIKLHELEKNINFADCYEEPEFKHEISLFLDKVPLEKDESLNINVMVGLLANRIKNRDRPGYRRKSVAFEVGDLDPMHRLQDNSGGKENVRRQDDDQGQYSGRGQDDGRGQNNVHTNTPEKSKFTRQPFDQDDYEVFQKEKPANSTMINPPLEPQRYNNEQLPDYRNRGIDSQQWYSFDGAGNPKLSREPPQEGFTYVPGQFQEQRLGGKFGDDAQNPSADLQQSSPRYARYGARDSADATRLGPPIRKYFDNSGNYIPSPVDQKQPNPAPQKINKIPLFNNQSAMQAPEDLDAYLKAPVPADDRPTDNSFRQFTSDKPASSSWQEPPENEYHSLLHDGPPRPTQSQPRTHYEPYELPPEEIQGGRFTLEGTRLSERPGQQTRNPSPYNPEQQPEDEYHSLQQTRNPSPYNPEPGNSRETPNYLEGGFIKSRPGMDQGQSNPEDINLPKPVQPPSLPESHRIKIRNLENSSREATSQISSDRAGMKQTNEQNKTPTIDRDPRTYIKITAPIVNSQPTSSQRPEEQDQRFLAQTPPQTGLSMDNQPVGSSTPNQRPTNDYPPNIKERRQVERERLSRRDYGTDDNQQGRQKCPCLERPMRCIRLPADTNFSNLQDQRPGERDRPSERDYGTNDDVERVYRGTRRCDTWYDYEDYIRAGIPLVCPYPYLPYPHFNLRKKRSQCSSRYKRIPKFLR